jgi:hypothetical protein
MVKVMTRYEVTNVEARAVGVPDPRQASMRPSPSSRLLVTTAEKDSAGASVSVKVPAADQFVRDCQASEG